MSRTWPNKYAHWPSYLPYPKAIRRSRLPVPNASAVNWPQAQFASEFLPPGSASFQPYSYTIQDGAASKKRVPRKAAKDYALSQEAPMAGYGDGFAWELAPLQATPLSMQDYGDIGGASYGCGCGGGEALTNPSPSCPIIKAFALIGAITVAHYAYTHLVGEQD